VQAEGRLRIFAPNQSEETVRPADHSLSAAIFSAMTTDNGRVARTASQHVCARQGLLFRVSFVQGGDDSLLDLGTGEASSGFRQLL
jgi:hypothetical protein